METHGQVAVRPRDLSRVGHRWLLCRWLLVWIVNDLIGTCTYSKQAEKGWGQLVDFHHCYVLP